jgi:hypothetical protein
MEPSGKDGRGGEVSLAAPGHDGMPVRSRPTTALAIWSSVLRPRSLSAGSALAARRTWTVTGGHRPSKGGGTGLRFVQGVRAGWSLRERMVEAAASLSRATVLRMLDEPSTTVCRALNEPSANKLIAILRNSAGSAPAARRTWTVTGGSVPDRDRQRACRINTRAPRTSKTRGCRDGRHAPAAVLSPRP